MFFNKRLRFTPFYWVLLSAISSNSFADNRTNIKEKYEIENRTDIREKETKEVKSVSSRILKYDLEQSRGDYIQQFLTPSSHVIESCVVPKHFPEMNYRDKDRENEVMLCGLDFYGQSPSQKIPLESVAICPKNRSTNPAVEVYKIKDNALSVSNYQEKYCRIPSKQRNKKVAKRVAKFKQSISCSYTPSILAYYHVSRMLGNIANVPVAVVRTMSLKEHRKIAKLGYQTSKKYKQRIQAITWKSFIEVENNIDNKKNKLGRKYSNRIFTKDNQQIYGAMQKDVKNEEKYKQFYIQNKKNSYIRLSIQPFVKKLMRENLNKTLSINEIYQLKDYSDMLVLDYLLSQEDRFGNMAYKDYYYIANQSTNKVDRYRISKNVKEKHTPKQYQNAGYHKIRRLVLKDNDCGVNRFNRTKKSKIMSKIRHLNIHTYQELLRLESHVKTKLMEKFFKQELLFSDKDWYKFSQNTQQLAKTLKNNCRSGKLSLDLNPDRKLLNLKGLDSKEYCS